MNYRETAIKVLDLVDAGLVKGVGKPIKGQMCVEAVVCFALGLPHGDDPKCVSPALRSLKIRLNDSNFSSNEARAKALRRLSIIQLGSLDALNQTEFLKRVAESVIRKQVPIALRAAASGQKNADHKRKLLDAALRCEKEGTRESASDASAAAYAASAAAAAYVFAAAADADAFADADAAYAAYAADAAASAAAYAASAAAAGAADAYAAAYAAAFASADAGAAYAADAADAAAYAARDKVLTDFAEDVVQILIAMDVPGVEWLDLAPIEGAT